MEKIKNFFQINKYNIILSTIFLIGILIRIVGISDYPNALNVDEASAGYEAYSILTTGNDRNGNFLPVYLVAWGSGQNALLTYLIIPFISLFGLTTLSIRLPMAIIGSISLFFFYFLLKEITNKKLALIGLAFFAICPWHILKSRWGLESNLFPDFILYFLFFLIKGLKNRNKKFFYLSFIFAGLSAYAYATSYFFLPLFIIPLLIILIRKKEITLVQSFFAICIIFIITLPLILFVLINTFHLPQLNLPFMTIPRLSSNRYEELTSIFSMNFLTQSISNFVNSLYVLLLQYDNLPWNALKFFGTIYPISTIFLFLGILICFSKQVKKIEINYYYIFNLYFIICLLLMFICEPNINRLNIIFIPIIYYCIIGIYFLLKHKQKLISIALIAIYSISFILMLPNYFSQDWNSYFTFEGNLEEVFNYTNHLENKKIYITNKIKEPYMYVLFYTKYSSQDFYQSVEYDNPHTGFRQVTHFGNYYFTNISNISVENQSCIYIIKKEDFNNYSFEKNNFKIIEFKNYIAIEQII
ncbi:MAG: glycosyltransferase family 39 protein [Clostridia bacterium]|jgi:4-amino-4-deoxy-L-arabinose transferase-like glycosyltransferase|nr:glycosyltransferase family 39 protein [Clostridia bacterium]